MNVFPSFLLEITLSIGLLFEAPAAVVRYAPQRQFHEVHFVRKPLFGRFPALWLYLAVDYFLVLEGVGEAVGVLHAQQPGVEIPDLPVIYQILVEK